jgi:hypothetical protein
VTEQIGGKPSWEEYYRTKRDELERNLGKMEAIDPNKYDPKKWGIYMLGVCRDLLQITNSSRIADNKLEKQIKQNEEKMFKIAESHAKYNDASFKAVDTRVTALRKDLDVDVQSTRQTLETINRFVEHFTPMLEELEHERGFRNNVGGANRT